MPSSTFTPKFDRSHSGESAGSARLVAVLLLSGFGGCSALAANPQAPPPAAAIASASSAEDVLAEMVHASGAIFAGQVYAIRLPAGAQPAGGPSATPVPSTRPDAVDVEFRVDVGVRGTSVGTNYILHMPPAEWQQDPAFALHQRAMLFLRPPDANGLSGPVQGAGDPAGQPAGVLPLRPDNTVDLSRLTRLVQPSGSPAAAGSARAGGPANTTTPVGPPPVPDVSTAAGRDTLESGSREGRMPELNAPSVPFLALMRDVTVLNAAEAPPAHPAETR